MEIYWILGAAFVVALFFFIFIFANGVNKANAKSVEHVEVQRVVCVKDEDARDIVFKAYKSLARQRAVGYGPWIAACLSRPFVPAGVALQALKRTRDELNVLACKPRFDLNELGRLILALEVKTGEWG